MQAELRKSHIRKTLAISQQLQGKTMKPVLGIVLSCCAVAAVGTGLAQAQQPAASDGAVDEGEKSGVMIQEVIVTAQRRSERMQDVPLAVTAVSGVQLKAFGVDSALDLRIAAPSLNSTNASGYVANSIRGVGSLGFAPGIESPVGLYVDGIYLAAPQASELTLNNISSVEVLKGPQGTLFGRNATGGVIQITTATPTAESSANVSLSYGNFNTWAGSAYVSGGIAKDLAVDLAVTGQKRDGIGKNLFDGSEIGSVDHDISLRSKWVWTPGENTTLTAIGSYWDGKDTNGWFVQAPGTREGFVPHPGPIAPDLGYDANTNLPTEQDGRSALGALKIEHDFAYVRFLSTTAYRYGTLDLVRDLDYTSADLAGLVLRQVDRQFSQELQFTSISDGPFKWTGGLFYFFLHSEYSPLVVDLLGQTAFFPPLSDTVSEKQDAKSVAGYGQGSYEIYPNTNITIGLRYTTEKRRSFDTTEILYIPAFGGVVPTGPYPDRSQTARKPTYRASLDHRFSDQMLGYVSFNTGFKSGGYNTGAAGAPGYSPETLSAFEVGLKTDLFGRRLRFNVAGFYYDYKDIQVQRVATANLIVFNGAKAHIYGADADFTALLSDHFNVTGGINWINTKFVDFPVCPISTPGGGVFLTVGTCTGNQIPFAAKFAGTVALNYATRVGAGEIQASTNLYYNSGYFFESDNVTQQSPYGKLGASLKWTSNSGFNVGVLGRNLTDRRSALLSFSQTTGNVGVAYADPRTYGITVGYKF